MAHSARVARARGNKEMTAALIEAAARLIATEGAGALTLRRVADEVGTSTMAIYTHFGGMPELRRAVRREAAERLGERLTSVGQSDDPVVDLAKVALAYYRNGIKNPHLYRVMFMEQPLDEADANIGRNTFETVIDAMQRCIDAGRFDQADATELATQYWAVGHGILSLQLANLITPEEGLRCMAISAMTLFTGYGDEPEAARRALKRVVEEFDSESAAA